MKRIFTRETYNRVKRLDRRDMETFFEEVYKGGYEDGRASVPGIDVGKIYEAIETVKGIGPKKMQEIRATVDAVMEAGR